MAAVSGFGGRVAIRTRLPASVDRDIYVLPVGRWSVTTTRELKDYTNSRSGNTREYLVGYRTADVNFDAYWDNTLLQSPFRNNETYRIRDGDSVRLVLYIQPKSYRGWYFGNFLVESVNMTSEVRGVVKYTISGKQSGQKERNLYDDSYISFPDSSLGIFDMLGESSIPESNPGADDVPDIQEGNGF